MMRIPSDKSFEGVHFEKSHAPSAIPKSGLNRVVEATEAIFASEDSSSSHSDHSPSTTLQQVPRQEGEIRAQFQSMREQHQLGIPKTDDERRVELGNMYDAIESQLDDLTRMEHRLTRGQVPLTKEEWVEMKLKLEKKLDSGLLNRLKRAARVLGKGLFNIKKLGLKGTTLHDWWCLLKVIELKI